MWVYPIFKQIFLKWRVKAYWQGYRINIAFIYPLYSLYFRYHFYCSCTGLICMDLLHLCNDFLQEQVRVNTKSSSTERIKGFPVPPDSRCAIAWDSVDALSIFQTCRWPILPLNYLNELANGLTKQRQVVPLGTIKGFYKGTNIRMIKSDAIYSLQG